MKRIAIINQRYGKEVIGGSEAYTMLLARQLKKKYEVEILTSRSLTYDTWGNEYPKEQSIDGIKVRRFSVEGKRHLFMRRIVRNLIMRFSMKGKRLERIWIRVLGPYIPGLITYLEEHEKDYDVFLFVTYLYYPTVMGMPKVLNKSVFIPTAHEEPYINLNVYRNLFENSRAIGYLTEEEKEMVENKFQVSQIPNEVIGAGIEIPKQIEIESFRRKYQITGEYIVYVGRIESMKGCKDMFEAFSKWRGNEKNISLIVVGKAYMKIPKGNGIHYLGMVSEEEKYAAMKGATALWLPSANESLSLVVLEAMAVGTPVLVNGRCTVLEGHCRRSQAGIAYHNEKELMKGLDRVYEGQCEKWKTNAIHYVQNYYTWEKVMNRLERLLF